jgi:hypothetical protein
MARLRHPNKEIEAAVAYAIGRGWTLTAARGHAWGILWCPHGRRGGCWMSVHSTPRVPRDHADQIRRNVDRCPH